MTLQNSIYQLAMKWQKVATPTTMVTGNGYIVAPLSAVVFTLPSVINIGDFFAVQATSPSGPGFQIQIAPSTTQVIKWNDATGTNLTGTNGYGVSLLCVDNVGSPTLFVSVLNNTYSGSLNLS